MKKFFLMLSALFLGFNAYAFEFDGIDLDDDFQQVTRAISKKNYVNDPVQNCLKGNCQGTEIYLRFNYTDVKKANKLGQLIVDVPMQSADAAASCTVLFDVIYHRVAETANGKVYTVDDDGTTCQLEKTADGIRLTYNTPYYKAPKNKK